MQQQSRQVLIIPGFMQGPFSPYMRWAARPFERGGADVRIARIHWRGSTLTDWLMEIEEDLDAFYMPETTIVGFAHGAMIAALIASRQAPAQVVLCALPALWAEDVEQRHWTRRERTFAAARMQAFRAYHFEAIASAIISPTAIFVGAKEVRNATPAFHRAKEAHRLIRHSELHIVPRAGHSVFHPNYRHAIGGLARAH